jgi:putative superfamily III holin-X
VTTSAPRPDSAQPRTSATATEPNQPVSGGIAGSGEPTIGELVQQASTQLSALVHGEIELAKAELSTSFKNAGTGAGFFIGAAVALFYATMFILIAAAEGLVALGVPRAAAYLIVFGFLVLMMGILVLLGRQQVKKVKAPERTISETKETAAFLKNPTQYTS